MKEVVKRAFNGKSKEWETRHLRDSFMNACEKAKIPQKIADVMAGHKPEGAKSNYAVQPETITTLYKDVFKFLTINGYGTQSRKLEELNHKIEEQNMQIAALTKMLGTVVPPEDVRKAILEAAKTLPDMTPEKLIHIENNLKMFGTVTDAANKTKTVTEKT
jgi:hypothetical protein